MATFRDFRSRIDAFKKKVPVQGAASAVRVARNLQLEVAFRTPVDTGAAKDSWNLSVDRPNPNFKERLDGYHNPSRESILGEVTVEGFELGKELHVSNNTRYIEYLNDPGTSPQAPPHFVEATVAEFATGNED